jgi:hypothetical protein
MPPGVSSDLSDEVGVGFSRDTAGVKFWGKAMIQMEFEDLWI